MLNIQDYVALDTLPVPPTHEMLSRTSSWPMLANNKFPCCTSAAAGHMVHHWTEANQLDIVLTDNDIIQAHSLLTGGKTDQAVSMLDALKFWRNTGIGDHKIHSFMSAGHAKIDTLRALIYLFGAAYIGLDLPNFAVKGTPAQILETPWQISPTVSPEDAAPQLSNGHCVAVIGYDENVAYAVTWGTLKTMSWDFFTRYTDEVFAVLSMDWVKDKASPTGFDLSTLEHDLSLVTSAPLQ
jgi:hypothetical protein